MKQQSNFGQTFASIFPWLIIPLEFVLAIIIFTKIMGDPSNFVNGDVNNNPLQGNFLGVIYKGGVIVPILMTLLLTVLTFAIERGISLSKVTGKGSVVKFVRKIKSLLAEKKIDEASELCDKQKGSVANVAKMVLKKYKEMEKETFSKDQKLLAIQKEVEDATALELPEMQRNMPILATIASLATLVALLGTVLGMIRAFAALANAGAPDSIALATGISEALINTAFGIGSPALAVVFYAIYSTWIDRITHGIDEAGYSITETFAVNH